MTTLFEALRESHDLQRTLLKNVLATSGDSAERQAFFDQLKTELSAHALSEERHFYAPLMKTDTGIDMSRHAIAEHHEMDELVEELEDADPASAAWLPLARKLEHKVLHHLEDEEHGFFQMAGKLLDDNQKNALCKAYLEDYEKAKQEV